MTAVFCGFTGSFRQKSAISANVTVGYSWHLDLSRVPPLLAEGIQLLQLLRVCHVQQGSPSPAQRVLGKWITTLHTKIKMKAKKTPTVKQEGLSGFFFPCSAGKRHCITQVFTEKFLRKRRALSLHSVCHTCFLPTGTNCPSLTIKELGSTF